MKRINLERALIAFILLLSVLVRVWGLDYDLPSVYHPDEPVYIGISQGIFKTGDLNPHFFNYPSLFFYINALAYVPYYALGKLAGVFGTPSDILPPISLAMGVTRAQMPTAVLLGRIVTVLFGVGAVGLVFLIGKRLTGKVSVGLFASFLMAISPSSVYHSRFITPDSFVAFFAAASFLAAVMVYQQGETWRYGAAGICIGLTASSKYNGGLIVLPLLLAHFFRHGRTALKERNLYLALLLCGLGFLATTPFALIDFPRFLADFRFEAQHYSAGHAGMEGDTLKWYLEYMWRTAGIVYILAALEILRGIYSRSKEVVLLSAFPVVYFAFISFFAVRNDRMFLPLTPFLSLLAASFLAFLLDKASTLRARGLQKWFIVATVCLSIVSLIQPISQTVTTTLRLTKVNNRETARVWIADNLPAGAKIVIESYSPFVEPSQFSVLGVVRMIDHEPQWYIDQGFAYLVFSEGMYGRFYAEPERYSREVAQYDSLFDQFPLVMSFADGGYEIRIYEIK